MTPREEFRKNLAMLPVDEQEEIRDRWEKRAAGHGVELPERGENLVEYTWQVRLLIEEARRNATIRFVVDYNPYTEDWDVSGANDEPLPEGLHEGLPYILVSMLKDRLAPKGEEVTVSNPSGSHASGGKVKCPRH